MITAQAPLVADAALAGSPAARRLLREATAAPEQLGHVDIVGSAGTGKTVLLDALADVLAAAGSAVLRGMPDADPGDAALLVDDGQRRTPDELARLTGLATRPGGVLVVAHRPWPRPDGLSALGAALSMRRAPVVLTALDRAGVLARAAHLLGERVGRPSDAVVDILLTQTGGHPALVDRMLTALAEQDGPDPGRWRWDPAHPPGGLLAQLGYAVHRLPSEVRDLLRARALGAPLDPDLLVPLLGRDVAVDPAALDELVEAARAEGLLRADGAPIPLVSTAVLERTPPATRVEMQRALAERELDRGGNVLAAARRLLGTGASGARVACVFAAAADESLRTGLPGAGELYAAAVGAGAPALQTASRRAEAALRAGELDMALAQADQVLSASDQVGAADVTQAGTVAAAVLAHRGMLARSAALYRYLGAGMGREAVLAVPALIGTGALDEAREVLTGTSARPPTLLAGAEELMAQGVLHSATGSPTAQARRHNEFAPPPRGRPARGRPARGRPARGRPARDVGPERADHGRGRADRHGTRDRLPRHGPGARHDQRRRGESDDAGAGRCHPGQRRFHRLNRNRRSDAGRHRLRRKQRVDLVQGGGAHRGGLSHQSADTAGPGRSNVAGTGMLDEC